MIRINNDYLIEADESNSYTLKLDKHKKNKKGEDVFVTLGFYTSLESAFKGAKGHMIHNSVMNNDYSLDEAIKVVRDTSNEFTIAFHKVTEGDRV